MQHTSSIIDSKMHTFAIFIFASIAPFILMSAPVIAQQLAIEWSLSPSQVGRFFFVELGLMSFATIPAYFWAKKISFRTATVYAALLFATGNILSFFAQSFDFLLFSRAVSALGGGTLMIITIGSCAITAKPDRTYGLWVLGQVLLGALALFVLPLAFPSFGLKICYVVMFVMICCALPFYRYFADCIIEKKAAVIASQSQNKVLGWVAVFATLLLYIAIGGIWTFISSIGTQANIDPQIISSTLAISTIIGILGCILPSVIGDKLNRKYFLIFGYGLFFLALMLLLEQISQIHLVISILLFKFTWMFTIPFVLATTSSQDSTGKLMNTINLVIGGGLALGPVIAGSVIENSESFNLLVSYSIALFFVSFILIFICNLSKFNQAAIK